VTAAFIDRRDPATTSPSSRVNSRLHDHLSWDEGWLCCPASERESLPIIDLGAAPDGAIAQAIRSGICRAMAMDPRSWAKSTADQSQRDEETKDEPGDSRWLSSENAGR